MATLERIRTTRSYPFVIELIRLVLLRRGFGLAAEAAFWGMFALPWTIIALASMVGVVAQWAGPEATSQVTAEIVAVVERVLNQETVDQYVVPQLEQLVATGMSGLGVFGLLAALWSGSRVVGAWVEASQILNGARPRGWLRTRTLALLMFFAIGLVLAAVTGLLLYLPQARTTILLGVPGPVLAWLAAIVGIVLLILGTTTLMHVANPCRVRWATGLPGGVLSVTGWVFGSLGLRAYLVWFSHDVDVLGALAAPIAVMLWMLVTTYCVILGMALNAVVIQRMVAADPATAAFSRPEGDASQQ